MRCVWCVCVLGGGGGVPISWSSGWSGWFACRQKCMARKQRQERQLFAVAFCCRTARPSCLNRKMTLALGLCVLSNWHTNTPWAQQQICIKVMNQSHFVFCRLPGTGSIVAVSAAITQSQARAHIADLLSVCEMAIGGGGWRIEGSAVDHNAISHWSGWRKIKKKKKQ